jgi:hypothetical protein
MGIVTGTASTTKTTVSFTDVQNVFKIQNTGNVDIQFNVGVYTNQTVRPQQTWENRVNYSEYDLFTFQSTSTYTVTTTNDVEDLDEIVASLEKVTKPVLADVGKYWKATAEGVGAFAIGGGGGQTLTIKAPTFV